MGTNAVGPIQTLPGSQQQSWLPSSPSEDPTSVPVAHLDFQHPEYKNRYDTWLDLSLMYEGGLFIKSKAERLLKKRPREDEEVYAARLDRFTYQNILGTALGWYGAAMFDVAPEIFFDDNKSTPEFFKKFLDNCDGLGTTYIDFFKNIFQGILTYGSSWVLTDLRALAPGEDEPKSLEDQRSRGLLDPHLAAYTPLNVVNWQTNEVGDLEWAIVKTQTQQQEFLQKPKIVNLWYCYDRESYKVYRYIRDKETEVSVAVDDVGRTAELIRTGKHALSYVKRLPIRRLQVSQGLWLANRAYLQLIDHINQDNTLAWSLFMSNLAMPVIIGDVDVSNMANSETGYLQFPAGTKYGWSEPEGKSFVHSAKRVESLREECFRSMHLQQQGRSMKATPAVQSGRSKLLEMMPAKQVLSGMGDDVRRHMQDVLTDVKDARHEDKLRPNVRGFTFQDNMTTEEVFAVRSVMDMRIPSDTLEKYIQKKVAKLWMSDANRTILDKVYDEIEAGPTRQEMEQKDLQDRIKLAKEGMKTALNGQSTLPPGRGGSGPSVNNEDNGKEK